MSKVIILYAHPNPKSFNSAIKETAQAFLSKKGISFQTRDLYALGFNPVLSSKDFESLQEDVKQEQGLISQCEWLVLIFPMWWYSMPAILKGYIDRVFSYGFAYEERNGKIEGLLKDKKVLIFTTLGGSQEEYEKGFGECLKGSLAGIFSFCGMEVRAVEFFYSVPYISEEERKKYLRKTEGILEREIGLVQG